MRFWARTIWLEAISSMARVIFLVGAPAGSDLVGLIASSSS